MNFNMQDKEFLKEIDYIVGIANSARSPGATSVFSDISMAGDKAGTDNTNHNSWTEPAQVENTDIGANMDLSNKEAPESDASTPGNITDIQLSTKIAELLQQVQKKISDDATKVQAAQKQSRSTFDYPDSTEKIYSELKPCRKAYARSRYDGNRRELKCQVMKLEAMALRRGVVFSRVALVCLQADPKDFRLQKVERVTEFMPVSNAKKGKNNSSEVFYGAVVRLENTGHHIAVPHNRFVKPLPAQYYENPGDMSVLPTSVTVLLGPFDGSYLTQFYTSPPIREWINGNHLHLEISPLMSMAAFEHFSKAFAHYPSVKLPKIGSVKTHVDAASIHFENEEAFANPPAEEVNPDSNQPWIDAAGVEAPKLDASVPNVSGGESNNEDDVAAPPQKRSKTDKVVTHLMYANQVPPSDSESAKASRRAPADDSTPTKWPATCHVLNCNLATFSFKLTCIKHTHPQETCTHKGCTSAVCSYNGLCYNCYNEWTVTRKQAIADRLADAVEIDCELGIVDKDGNVLF